MNGVNSPPSSGCARAFSEKAVGDLGECFDAFPFAVFDHQFESACLAQAPDRRRLEHDGNCAADFLRDCGLKLLGECRSSELGCRSLAPFLQGHERRGRVGLIGGVQDVKAFEKDDVADSV